MMYDPVNNAPPGNQRRILLSGVHELEQVNGGAVIGSPRDVEMWKKGNWKSSAGICMSVP